MSKLVEKNHYSPCVIMNCEFMFKGFHGQFLVQNVVGLKFEPMLANSFLCFDN